MALEPPSLIRDPVSLFNLTATHAFSVYTGWFCDCYFGDGTDIWNNLLVTLMLVTQNLFHMQFCTGYLHIYCYRITIKYILTQLNGISRSDQLGGMLNLLMILCSQTLETLIRCRVLWRLIWVCTVCLCPPKRALDFNG